jgi:hypothetical protein
VSRLEQKKRADLSPIADNPLMLFYIVGAYRRPNADRVKKQIKNAELTVNECLFALST